MYVCVCVCVRVCAYVHTCLRLCIYIYTWLRVCICHVCIKLYVCFSFVGRRYGLSGDLSDPVQQARVDELLDIVDDVTKAAFSRTELSGPDRLRAREQASCDVSSKLHTWLRKIDLHLTNTSAKTHNSPYCCGATLTIADLRLFCELVAMVSGWYAGFPRSFALFRPYPAIVRLLIAVGGHPEVVRYYHSSASRAEEFAAFRRISHIAAHTPCSGDVDAERARMLFGEDGPACNGPSAQLSVCNTIDTRSRI
jgi:glutathione S-transferase